MIRVETIELHAADPEFISKLTQRADGIIDARSPSEFADDHAPGAANLPTLNDRERAEVGEIYVQTDRFLARRVGAAHASRNIARHLEGYFADKPAGFRPLVYCWRGGQRSRALATVLAEVGYPVAVLDGGWRRYRAHVAHRLYHSEPWFRPLLVDGPTCVGKTEILGALAAAGRPVVDLEALAAHRGSVFGSEPDVAQPSQKLFESRLLAALPTGAVVGAAVALEAEAAKIGARALPPTLIKAMADAPTVRIDAPLAARAAYAAERYATVMDDPDRLERLLGAISERHSRATLDGWRGLAAVGDAHGLAARLMAEHYDPAYARAAARRDRPVAARIRLERLDAPAFRAAADEIAALLSA